MALFHLEAEAWKRGVILRDAFDRAVEMGAVSDSAEMARYVEAGKRAAERLGVLCEGLGADAADAVMDAFEAGFERQAHVMRKGVEA